MPTERYILLLVLLALAIGRNLLAEDASPELSNEQRIELLQLPRKLAAARADAAARAAVVDDAIALGPLGIERVLPLLQKDALGQLTRYSNLFKKQAQRQPDATPEAIVASDETLQSVRTALVEVGGLLVRLQKAAGMETVSPEEQLASAEIQMLRVIRLGPIVSQISDLEIEAIEETNKHRVAHKLPPLQFDLKLCLAARDHSADMVAHGFFDHTSPLEGKTKPADRAARFGAKASGENIHAGSDTGAAAVTAWMNSEGHRANILKPTYRRVGIGHHDGHWTQLFGD